MGLDDHRTRHDMANTLIKAAEVVNGGIMRGAPTNARFDLQLISPHIADAERRWVIPVLTSAFHEDLLESRSSAASNYNTAIGATAAAFPTSAAYESLWTEHLLEYCSYAVLYESLPFIGVQIGAGGLYTNNTEWGEGVGVEGVKYMSDVLRERLEIKREQLKNYLCRNSTALEGFVPSAAGYCPSACSSAHDDDPSQYLGMIFY